ncbi:hypothetical protein CGRA01v4_11512 [Colletotrichum graminicola]|nr:hypothetical protein CGRA01v4_11512 [Colletotrichum graminicola]
MTKKPRLFSRFVNLEEGKSLKSMRVCYTDHITDSLRLQRVSRRRFSERKRAFSGASVLSLSP